MLNYYNPMIQNQFAYEQSLKNIIEQANGQLNQIHNQQPMQQPTNLTQNFQLAPNTVSNFRIVNNIEDVKKEVVIADTYFLIKDYSQLFIKNTRGDIRTFNLQEVIQKDEKDLMIEDLQKQINELKGSMNNVYTSNDKSNDVATNKQSSTEFTKSISTKKSTNISNDTTSKTE